MGDTISDREPESWKVYSPWCEALKDHYSDLFEAEDTLLPNCALQRAHTFHQAAAFYGFYGFYGVPPEETANASTAGDVSNATAATTNLQTGTFNDNGDDPENASKTPSSTPHTEAPTPAQTNIPTFPPAVFVNEPLEGIPFGDDLPSPSPTYFASEENEFPTQTTPSPSDPPDDREGEDGDGTVSA